MKTKFSNDFLHMDNGFKVYFDNKFSAIDTVEEIFIKNSYHFKSTSDTPFIIDVGSNIGISVLYFKYIYPQAKIIAIEPNPIAYQYLLKNIKINKLENITTYNAAAANTSGKVNLYGENYQGGYSLGNSIIKKWGLQRKTSSLIEVDSILISQLINQPIDLLKIDIEGAEMTVLTEIGAKLNYVKQILMEVHESNEINEHNKLTKIFTILNNYNYQTRSFEKNVQNVFPSETKEWEQKNYPRLHEVHATKIDI